MHLFASLFEKIKRINRNKQYIAIDFGQKLAYNSNDK